MDDRYRATMIGLAIGDTLGAPVEFMSQTEIFQKYGGHGIQTLERWGGFPAGYYTDDTQMSIATAEGILDYYWNDSESVEWRVYLRYLEWHRKQNIQYNRRVPGNTCMSALASGEMGTTIEPLNNSKGCGGVMRAAPCGLLTPSTHTPFELGAACAAITHGHVDGWYPAGMLAQIIHDVVINARTVDEATTDFIDKPILINGEIPRTMRLAQSHLTGVITEPEYIGGGWTGDEAIVMALAAVMSTTNFADAVIKAANITGDSDSVASIAGALAGAQYGTRDIPLGWQEILENKSLLISLADELHETDWKVYK